MGAPESADRSERSPRVFVSYAHETAAHNEWVKSLVRDLRAKGVDALLDEWKVSLGGDFTLFMESIRTCDRVLLICTPTYARKANEGAGGVGYERQIITAQLAESVTTTTFVCVLRSGNAEEAIPTFAKTRRYVDFRDDLEYDQRLEELLRDLLGVPAEPEPPVGVNPFTTEETKDGVRPAGRPASGTRKKGDRKQVGPAAGRVKKRSVPQANRWQRGAILLFAGIVLASLGYGAVRMWIWPASRHQGLAEDDATASLKETGREEVAPTPAGTEEPLLVETADKVGTGPPASVTSNDASISDTTVQAKILTLDLGGGVTMELVRIWAGEFMMGSPKSEEKRYNDEGPRHPVRIAEPFYMGKHEVTQAQWRALMGNNPSKFKGDERPVEMVSWEECRTFCRKLSERVGREIRLPSEAEWEYACRAGTTTPFSFGESISTDQANYDGNYVYGNGGKGEYRKQTTPVGSFAANAFGLFDMHGNVWEWCADVWHDTYDGAPSDGAARGRASGQASRVLRGGSWLDGPWGLRSADRYRARPGNRYDLIGFRVASGT